MNEYTQHKCLYCNRKTLTQNPKLKRFRHISKPKTFKYLKCQSCLKYQCVGG